MSGAVGRYPLSVVASAMLLSLVQSILPKGPVRRIGGFVGGLLVIIAVLSPVVDVDYDALARSITRFQVEAEDIEASVSVSNRELMSGIIKQQCETYIWDKANKLGADLEVTVTLSEDEYPSPIYVALTGKFTQEQRNLITEYIARDIGVPVQRQEWKLK